MLELLTLNPLDIIAILPMDAKPFDQVVTDMAADVDTAFKAIVIVVITLITAAAVFKRGFSFAGLVLVGAAAAFATWLLIFGGIGTLAATFDAWADNVTENGG